MDSVAFADNVDPLYHEKMIEETQMIWCVQQNVESLYADESRSTLL